MLNQIPIKLYLKSESQMVNKIRLLVAEDEPSLGMIIKESLETRNFIVTLCDNGNLATTAFANNNFDALVLDVMMPQKDGFTLAKEIRKTSRKIPIIFLTSKSQTQDVLDGFAIGCNDYIKKPFSLEELIVRILALLERNKEAETKVFTIGNYIFDYTKQTLVINNKTILLTHRESTLLEFLCTNKNEIINRSLILKNIWGNDDFFSGRSMDVFITKLRKKLDQDKSVQIINIRGFGYKIIC